MANWAGFTDEDLRKLKGQKHPPGMEASDRRPANLGKPKPGQPRRSIPPQNKGRPVVPGPGVISPAQKLSQPPMASQLNLIDENDNSHDVNTKQSLNNSTHENRGSQETVNSTSHSDKNGNVEAKSGNDLQKQKVEEEPHGIELSETQVISQEMKKLEKYQHQQKMMEELNKQRKEMLSKTIAERSKRAKAESSKLNHIQKELGHLDHLLTADVSLIRDRIEEASLSFMEAQKRYNKAEKEFVESKMHLFKTAETKDQLTEHLYTIIHKNELRKAQKLNDLMKQLEMEISSDEMDMTLPDLPPLTSFNSVQTLSPTRAPQCLSYSVKSSTQPEPSNHEHGDQATILTTQPVSQNSLPPVASVSQHDTTHAETSLSNPQGTPPPVSQDVAQMPPSVSPSVSQATCISPSVSQVVSEHVSQNVSQMPPSVSPSVSQATCISPSVSQVVSEHVSQNVSPTVSQDISMVQSGDTSTSNDTQAESPNQKTVTNSTGV